MTGWIRMATTAVLLCLLGTPEAQEDVPGLDDDYYLGFSQGAYYGLMLAGIEYDVAWCVKAELDFEAGRLGAGSEFQARLERIFTDCQEEQ